MDLCFFNMNEWDVWAWITRVDFNNEKNDHILKIGQLMQFTFALLVYNTLIFLFFVNIFDLNWSLILESCAIQQQSKGACCIQEEDIMKEKVTLESAHIKLRCNGGLWQLNWGGVKECLVLILLSSIIKKEIIRPFGQGSTLSFLSFLLLFLMFLLIFFFFISYPAVFLYFWFMNWIYDCLIHKMVLV